MTNSMDPDQTAPIGLSDAFFHGTLRANIFNFIIFHLSLIFFATDCMV